MPLLNLKCTDIFVLFVQYRDEIYSLQNLLSRTQAGPATDIGQQNSYARAGRNFIQPCTKNKSHICSCHAAKYAIFLHQETKTTPDKDAFGVLNGS